MTHDVVMGQLYSSHWHVTLMLSQLIRALSAEAASQLAASSRQPLRIRLTCIGAWNPIYTGFHDWCLHGVAQVSNTRRAHAV